VIAVLKVATVVLVGSLVCCAGASARSHGGIAPSDAEWLFKHSAQHATVRPIAGSQKLRLTLRGTAPTVRAVARGEAPFDLQSLADFVSRWKTYGFADKLPNAAIVAPGGGPAHDVLIAKLSHPKLGKAGLSYLAKPLEGRTPADLSYFKQSADQSLPPRLGKTSVYLDDADDNQIVVPINFNIPDAFGGTVAFSSPVVLDYQLSGDATVDFRPPSPYPAWSPADAFTITTSDVNSTVTGYADMAVNPTGTCIWIKVSGLDQPGGVDVSLSAQDWIVPLKDGVNLVSNQLSNPNCTP